MDNVDNINYDLVPFMEKLIEVDGNLGLDTTYYINELDPSYLQGEPDFDDEIYERHMEYSEPDIKDADDIIDDMFDSLRET
ncbi:hypothetical protein ACM26V_04425 [Salipaludibacillus sp. HK11]|uniref:hypothetical protein n=1 Tax=Salipaludibacillus sp. HK11 TaxID=3394320 RepID=UPI0039FDC6A9